MKAPRQRPAPAHQGRGVSKSRAVPKEPGVPKKPGVSKSRDVIKPRGPGGTPAATTFDDVRAIAHKLPGVEDGTSYGTPALKVRGKLMVRVHQDLDCFVLRTELLDREMWLQSAPDVFFITDHYRDYPWILVRFAAVDKRALPELLERAWRLVAPATLVKKFDDADD